MSNCIEIQNSQLVIFSYQMDLEKFKAEVMKERTSDYLKEDEWNSILYWFLCPKNVKFEKDCVRINLGFGRSSHTWRDFKGTLLCLNSFLKKGEKFKKRFTIMDIDWGTQEWWPIDVQFEGGAEVVFDGEVLPVV